MESIESVLASISERARTFRPHEERPAEESASDNIARALGREHVALAKRERAPNATEHLVGGGTEGSDQPASPSRADVAIMTALKDPELDQVLHIFSDDWSKEGREGVVYNVCTITVQDLPITIVAASQNDMGMVPAAILATKTVRAWEPRIMAMVGVCAGVKGKVNLGDVVVGKQLFDYGSGKIEGGQLTPDYQPMLLNEQVCSYALELAGSPETLADLKAQWPTQTGKPDTELRAHVGPMASGAAVVATESVVVGIREHKRSLLAIDMESYGMARAAAASARPPLALAVKAVQDFADEVKNDDYREYAAFVSAQFLYRFLSEYWAQLRP
jgi:nucleoside phosphorylase